MVKTTWKLFEGRHTTNHGLDFQKRKRYNSGGRCAIIHRAVGGQSKFCQKDKGLNIHPCCIMTNHVHLIVSTCEPIGLSDVIRDLKKFTSSEVIKVGVPPTTGSHGLDKFLMAYFYISLCE